MNLLRRARPGRHFFAPGAIQLGGRRRRAGARMHFALLCLVVFAAAMVIGVLAGLAQVYGWAP